MALVLGTAPGSHEVLFLLEGEGQLLRPGGVLMLETPSLTVFPPGTRGTLRLGASDALGSELRAWKMSLTSDFLRCCELHTPESPLWSYFSLLPSKGEGSSEMITTGLPGTLLDLFEATLAQMLLDKERPLLLELQFTELLIRLYDVLVPHCPEEEEKPKALADTLTHMEENFFRDLGLEDLAAHSGWSVEYFSRTFKRHLGLTALEYLHQLRIRRACYLLKHTPQKILDISLEVGYNNVSFFNRYFRRLMGISPSEYRS